MARIYVGNCSFEDTEQQLLDFCSAFDEVPQVDVITDRHTARPRGFAFIEMLNYQEAQTAIKAVHGTEHGGRTLKVNAPKPRSEVEAALAVISAAGPTLVGEDYK